MDYETWLTWSWLKPGSQAGCVLLLGNSHQTTDSWQSHRATNNTRQQQETPCTSSHLTKGHTPPLQGRSYRYTNAVNMQSTMAQTWCQHETQALTWYTWNALAALPRRNTDGIQTLIRARFDLTKIKTWEWSFLFTKNKAGKETIFSSKRHFKEVTYTADIILNSEMKTHLVLTTRPQKTISEDVGLKDGYICIHTYIHTSFKLYIYIYIHC